MSGKNDAGYRALAGFFYQILASAAHGFQALSPPSCLNATQVEVSFALEQYGQDAASATDDGSTKTLELYQYKYSSDPAAHPIRKHELFEILDALQDSEALARAGDFDAIRFRLVTNRELHPIAQKLKDDAECDADNPDLDEPDKDRKGKTIRCRSRKVSQKQILKALVVDDSFDPDEATAVLQTQAASLGVLEDELARGIDGLIGFVFQRAASVSRTVTANQLNEKLAGFSNPRHLTETAIRQQMLERLEPFGAYSGIKRPLARRCVVDEIRKAMDQPLVLVVGDGGMGKTVAVLEALEGLLSASPAPPPFAVISPALDTDRFWLSENVSDWRNTTMPQHLHEPTARALQRLQTATANSARRPILLLALDAWDEVDEANPRRAKIRELIRFFADEVRFRKNGGAFATLVVSCRRKEELLDDLNLGGWEPSELTQTVIPVDKFDHVEVFDAAVACRLPLAVEERISRRANRGDPSERRGSSPGGVASIEETVYEAIRHPVLWNCFRELNETQQHSVLNGERIGLDEVARRLVAWFCRKANRRNRSWKRDDLRAALLAVAKHLDEQSPRGERQQHWIVPAGQVVGPVVAGRILTEAVSAGLILEPSKTEWRWRYRFVYEYLRDNDS